jgi:hypothetical protein
MFRNGHFPIQVALFAVVVAVFSHTRADPDLWGHVRFGQDTVTAGALETIDGYSFLSDRPWINHEWLAEILMYLAYAAGSGAGLILLKAAILSLMLWAVVSSWPRGLPIRSTALMVGLLVIGTVPQANHVRPQLFSLLAFAVLLRILVRGAGTPREQLWRGIALMVLFALWANLHGGWIVGVGTVGLWTAVELALPAHRRDGVIMVFTGAAALAATIATPYGPRLWQFLFQTVQFGREQITDWQPVYALGSAYVGIWLLVTIVAMMLIYRDHRAGTTDFRSIAVVMMLGVASFQVNRLLAFFALAVTALLTRALISLPRHAGAAARSAPALTSVSRKPAYERAAVAVAAVVTTVVLSGALAVAYDNATCIRMEPTMFPEPEASLTVHERGVRGRVLTWFDWGEYAIWHFSPAVSVSLDGRRETVYSDATVSQQFRFYFNPDERHRILEQIRPDYIWLPAHLEVTSALVADGWTPIFSGPLSVLLGREPAGGAPIPTAPAARRCFPGP